MGVLMSDFIRRAYDKYTGAGITAAGACGLIANQYAESAGFVANRLEFLCVKRLEENTGIKWTDEEYTNAVDYGRISEEEFLHPLPGKQYGYGLSQWTSPSRKANLYNEAHKRGCSIGDEGLAVDFTLHELKTSFSTVWNVLTKTQDLAMATRTVLEKFESPANPESLYNTRYEYALSLYENLVNVDCNSKCTVDDVLKIARSFIGCNESDGSHKKIIDAYNMYSPLARGYMVKYTDAWCDTFISALFILANAVDLIGGTECGCEEHINIFKSNGIWNEDGTIVPMPGYIVTYNWDDKVQPNNGYSDHIGIVEKVVGSEITVIEGNCNNAVERRVIPVGWGYIRGYACPKYSVEKVEAVQNGNEEKGCNINFIDCLKSLADEIVKDGWVYSNSGTRRNINKARNIEKKVTNCALFVSHALQLCGILSVNQTFYGKQDGSIKSNNGAIDELKKYCTITHYKKNQNVTDKTINLKYGDIVTYYGQHTNVFIGDANNKKWYDAGRGTTVNKCAGSKWKSLIRTGTVGMTISNVIRWNIIIQNNDGQLNDTVVRYGTVITDLNCRVYAGTEYPKLKSYPVIKEGETVGICDTVKAKNGDDWYFVEYKGKLGFCSAKYIK